MKKISLYIMAAFYVAAGINHFANSKTYVSIMPSYLPYHLQLVYVSGICEFLFGLLLIPVAMRRVAAWLIIALLVAIFPANIQMMINDWNDNMLQRWVTIIRLPIQVILIWWAYIFTKPVSSR
jgi:uncharacterized membrane protein